MVEQQLASFRAEMERDSAVQQERIQKLVRSAAAKTEALIDRELQLSSGNLTSYLFAGGSGPRPQDMPVAAGFRAEIGGVASEVQKLVQEHSRFANSNAKRQLDNYRWGGYRRAIPNPKGTPKSAAHHTLSLSPRHVPPGLSLPTLGPLCAQVLCCLSGTSARRRPGSGGREWRSSANASRCPR